MPLRCFSGTAREGGGGRRIFTVRGAMCVSARCGRLYGVSSWTGWETRLHELDRSEGVVSDMVTTCTTAALFDSSAAFALWLFPHLIAMLVPPAIVWVIRRRGKVFLRDWFVVTAVIAGLSAELRPAARVFTSGHALTIIFRVWLAPSCIFTSAIVAAASTISTWVLWAWYRRGKSRRELKRGRS
jgi:hypothetical protein